MKLKDEDIIKITKLVDEDYNINTLSQMFNVAKSTMNDIVAKYKKHGLKAIMHGKSKSFTIEEKFKIINRYYSGASIRSLCIEINVNRGVIHSWISKYEKLGYNGLIDDRGKPGKTKMGRPRKKQTLDQETSTTEPMAPLSNIERQELNELRKKTYEQQMEIDCLKKIQALVQKRQSRQTKKK